MERTHPFESPHVVAYSMLLADSYIRATGNELITPGDDVPRRLFHAPFALVSHGTEADPIFCYANATALTLWQMTWTEFTSMPSRLSVAREFHEERARLLEEAHRLGHVTGYQGVRIAKKGGRFMIRDTVLWNVVDSENKRLGQACLIRRWDHLPL